MSLWYQMNMVEERPKFYIMVGNIGSGKSTYIKNNMKDATVISKDSLRYAIGGGNYIFDPKLEPVIHNTSVYMVDQFCHQKKVQSIVLDETNVQAKNRKQFINLAKEHGYDVIAVVFPNFPKDVAVNRRLTNPHCQPDRELWESVWDKFNNRYKHPTLEEGFHCIINVEEHEVM